MINFLASPRGPATATTLLAAMACVLLLFGCSPVAPQEADHGLDEFHQQTLEFGTCSDETTGAAAPLTTGNAAERAECALLQVPLDYEDPEGETAQIALLRVPATGEERTGSVVTNPGGPGFSGTSFAVTLADLWADGPITLNFDIVGFDPRGVGSSVPSIDCYDDEQREADAPLLSLTSGSEEWDSSRAADFVAGCAERTGGAEALSHLSTRDVARDMDVLREVLGDDQLTFAGASYGTRIGAVYADMYPERVRAMVLDGGIDPTADKRERRLQQFSGFQRAFEEMATFCSTQADCPLGDEPNKAVDRFQQIVRALDENPAPTTDGRELNTIKAIDGAMFSLYGEEVWPLVLEGLAAAEAGSGDELMFLRDAYQQRQAGTYSNALEANAAIDCMDEERSTPEEETSLKREVYEIAPFLDPGHEVATIDVCTAWPADPEPAVIESGAIEGLADTLVISVLGDPTTPHEGAVQLSETLGGSLLTVEGNQHGTLLETNECIVNAVENQLVHRGVPDPGTTCSLAPGT